MAGGDNNKMGLFSSQNHKSTTIRYVTVAALGFTALVIVGVARHSGLIEQRQPRTAATGRLDPTQLNLGQGVVPDDDAAVAGTASRRQQEVRSHQQQQKPHQNPQLEKEKAAAPVVVPRLGGTPFPAFDGNPAVYRYEIVNKFPHDPTAFTQGFLFAPPDTVFESTGSVGGPSTVREVDLTTGEVRRRTELGRAYFAEGLTMYKGKLAQITWRNNRGFYYDPATLEKTGEFTTPLRDGWGLTTDVENSDLLIVTDASKHLHFVDPTNAAKMTLSKSTVVTDGDKVVRFTNELETVGDEVWANVLERDCIARIDPRTGKVVGWIMLNDLKAMQDPAPGVRGVLNGIAYDAGADRVFVTGKMWSNVFEIKLVTVETSKVHDEASTNLALNEARRVCWPEDSLPAYGYP